MFKIIFIFMLLFLALASLTILNHLFLNQFITEHRNTFSSRDNVSVSFTHITEWQIKDDTIYEGVSKSFEPQAFSPFR